MLAFRLVVQPAFCRARLDTCLGFGWHTVDPFCLIVPLHPSVLLFSSNTYYNGRWEPGRERHLPGALDNLLGLVTFLEALSVRFAAVHLQRRWFTGILAKSHVVLLCESR